MLFTEATRTAFVPNSTKDEVNFAVNLSQLEKKIKRLANEAIAAYAQATVAEENYNDSVIQAAQSSVSHTLSEAYET